MLSTQIRSVRQLSDHKGLTSTPHEPSPFPSTTSPGKRVHLSTTPCRHKYKINSGLRSAKLRPLFDGHSTVTLDLPRHEKMFRNAFTTMTPNTPHNLNATNRHPMPVIIKGQPNFFLDRILDERVQHNRTQYLVWSSDCTTRTPHRAKFSGAGRGVRPMAH